MRKRLPSLPAPENVHTWPTFQFPTNFRITKYNLKKKRTDIDRIFSRKRVSSISPESSVTTTKITLITRNDDELQSSSSNYFFIK